MSLPSFLMELASTGRVQVPRGLVIPPEDAAGCRPIIRALDDARRLEMAYSAPPLAMETALWAGTTLYHACQFFVFRELSADLIQETLATPCPEPVSAETIYSADLLLSHLPQLARLARGISPGDPLLNALAELGRRWPLSSVGMGLNGPFAVDTILADRSLEMLYVDRIIERADMERLDHPAVRLAVSVAIGPHSQLSPKIAAGLKAAEGEN
jgi:hypothetical protein